MQQSRRRRSRSRKQKQTHFACDAAGPRLGSISPLVARPPFCSGQLLMAQNHRLGVVWRRSTTTMMMNDGWAAAAADAGGGPGPHSHRRGWAEHIHEDPFIAMRRFQAVRERWREREGEREGGRIKSSGTGMPRLRVILSGTVGTCALGGCR